MSSWKSSAEEDFELLKPKVEALIHHLELTGTIEVSDINVGSFNRVVRVKTSGDTLKPIDGILRMARYENVTNEKNPQVPTIDPKIIDAKVQEHTSVLHYIRSAGVSVPSVLAYDATFTNPIMRPYVLQETAMGVSLQDVYEDLPVAAKHGIAESLADFLATMERVTFEHCGKLGIAATEDITNLAPSSIWTSWTQVIMTDVAIQVGGLQIGDFGNVFVNRTTVDLYEFFSEQLRSWIAWELEHQGHDLGVDCYEGLKVILEEMKEFGFFEVTQKSLAPRNILYYWDLAPRNIIAKRKASADQIGEVWEISKIIDWVDVRAMPAVLTRMPPIWLWDWEDVEGHFSVPATFDDDIDQLSPTRYDPEEGRLDEDNASIRPCFEQTLIKNLIEIYPNMNRAAYMDQAYGRGRWLRLFARFVTTSFQGNQD